MGDPESGDGEREDPEEGGVVEGEVTVSGFLTEPARGCSITPVALWC